MIKKYSDILFENDFGYDVIYLLSFSAIDIPFLLPTLYFHYRNFSREDQLEHSRKLSRYGTSFN